MKNIGIICEGPTDYIVLKGIVDKITGEDNEYLQLQPEANLLGEYGNGWKGVWKWCIDHADILESFMKDITPQLDLLIIQMDGDVARKEKEVHCLCNTTECELKEIVHPLECEKIKDGECPIVLPCKNHDVSVEGYIEHLTALITKWLKEKEGFCVAIPCDSTEAWITAAYDELAEVENIEDPWKNVISKGKSYHGIRIPGRKKRLLVYRQFVGRVCDNWEVVKKLCVSAAQFDENIRKYYEKGREM